MDHEMPPEQTFCEKFTRFCGKVSRTVNPKAILQGTSAPQMEICFSFRAAAFPKSRKRGTVLDSPPF